LNIFPQSSIGSIYGTFQEAHLLDISAHNKIVSFIWSIADDCLHDIYVRGKYSDVILPMFVLRRLDCLLEPSKETVMEEVAFQRDDAGFTDLDPKGTKETSDYVFYNTSPWTLLRENNDKEFYIY
jgi:type I restriction enzyme M protein